MYTPFSADQTPVLLCVVTAPRIKAEYTTTAKSADASVAEGMRAVTTLLPFSTRALLLTIELTLLLLGERGNC